MSEETKKEKVAITRNKFSKAEQAWLMNEIAERYFKGKYQSAIADELTLLNPAKPVTQQLISYYLKKLQKNWMALADTKFDQAKAVELAKIDNLERTYWLAWERSLKPVKVKESAKDGDVASAGVKEYDTQGEKKFLDGVQWCIEKRCEILGLDAPKRLTTEGFNMNIDWSKCTFEQVDRIRRGESPLNVLTPEQYSTDSKK